MKLIRVTKNGQICIPQDIREAAQIQTGDFGYWEITKYGLLFKLLEPNTREIDLGI